MRKLLSLFLVCLALAGFAQNKILIQQPVVWTPQSLTPAAWWDSRSADMSATGDYWNDRSGNGYNVTATGTQRPTYNSTALNGRPGFVFDGALTFFLGAATLTQIHNVTNATLWMVNKRSVFANSDATNIFQLNHFTDDNYYAIPASTSAGYGSSATSNAFHYVLMIFDGTATGNSNRLKVYKDGVLQTLSFTGTIGTNTENGSPTIEMGYNGLSTVAGTIVEVGVVGRTISGTEITNLNSYLATTYGL